ncbi:MAG: hypothetical protein Q9186_001650 [Xanthomendoza sp. 1 TL-2023]
MSTTTSISPKQTLPSLTLIVATTPSLGIGLRGSLPWPTLKADLQFFARVTKRPPTLSSSTTSEHPAPQPRSDRPETSNIRNAVIMGRKTFDSIPPKFRPLKDRVNVVVTRSPDSSSLSPYHSNKDVIITSSISDGLQRLQSQEKEFGRVFVIGGAEIYKQSIGLRECERVLWTRLSGEWECDTWFPDRVIGDEAEESGVRGNGWRRKTREELENWTGEDGLGGVRKEGDVEFEVSMWERETMDAV